MKYCSKLPSSEYTELVATLDLLTVPLLEDCLLGIITSFQPGEMKAKTSLLTSNLHDLEGQDLVNALLFLSAVTAIRKDAGNFLTIELIEKTYQHMMDAESESHHGITGAAMTLLANIAIYRPEEVMERLEIDEEHPRSSTQKTLDLISTKTIGDWKKGRAGQNVLTVHDLITHRQHQAEAPESCHFTYHLLHPSYGSQIHWDNCDVLHDTDTTRAAMCHYITRVLNDEERRKVLHYLLIALRSAVRTSKFISVIFFSELLCHPGFLQKKMAKDFILLMASKMESADELEVCLAVEALGNASESDQRLGQKLKDDIIKCLCSKLSDDKRIQVVIKSLQALSKYVTLLKRSQLGRTFGQIAHLCSEYLNHENPIIQKCSTSLFSDLAQNCNWNKRGFRHHVRRCLTDLLIKLHSQDQQVKASAIAALLHCLPYIACHNAQELLRSDAEKCKIYEQLGTKELVKMLLHSTDLDYMMLFEPEAILQHLTIIRDALPYQQLSAAELRGVFNNLKEFNRYCYVNVRETCIRAIDVLGTKWKSIATAKVVRIGRKTREIYEEVKLFERERPGAYETAV